MALLTSYREKLAEGILKPDAAQEHVVKRLQALAAALNMTPPVTTSRFTGLFRKPPPPPRGLYIHGEVGRGKTMLMDLFFAAVEGWPKRRIHFHAFMQEVHAARARLGGDKVIERIADGLSAEARLLCLDEMQVTDIADAMIIGRLYEALLARGVVLVTTSNLPPSRLYTDGLNRQLFLPFIARLEGTLDVISLDSPRDYRLGRLRARDSFLHPVNASTRAAFATLWNDLTDHAAGAPTSLAILGRTLAVPSAAHGCARFHFDDLCRAALGAPDYLAIAKHFPTVFVEGIATLSPAERNEAKRFVLMIDTFYDAGTRLVALSAVPPEKIVAKNHHSFEFQRTLSRLKEMQSASWWGTVLSET